MYMSNQDACIVMNCYALLSSNTTFCALVIFLLDITRGISNLIVNTIVIRGISPTYIYASYIYFLELPPCLTRSHLHI